jgi:hypothetical protein
LRREQRLTNGVIQATYEVVGHTQP